jgi:hypothetical protein
MKLKSLGVVITLALSFSPARTFAQVGPTTDILMGDGEGGRRERRGPGGE